MFAKHRGSQTLTVPKILSSSAVFSNVLQKRRVWPEPFSARVGEVYLISGYRTLTVAYAVSGSLAYLSSPRHRGRAGRIRKDAGDELFLQLPLSD